MQSEVLNDFLTLITALVIAITCAVQGVFLTLRKLSMVGDAISHSVLPGIVCAYLLFGRDANFAMLVFSALFGLLSTVLIEMFRKKTGIREDAAIGIVFTTLFAIGIILLASFANSGVEIDQECVLFGELGTVFFFKIYLGEYLIGTKALWFMLPVTFTVFMALFFGKNGLRLMSFDENYGVTLGININKWHYGQMFLLSLTSVMAFESVGAIMVVGMLVVPAVNANIIFKSLRNVLFLSVLLASSAVVIAWVISKWLNITLSGTIVSVAGIQLFISLIIMKLVKIKIKTIKFSSTQ
jgi:manganese/zinc/iron transport system permease protein